MEKRRMCPHCRAFISTDDRVCPYCETRVGPKAIERRPSIDAGGGLLSQARFTTTIILLINTGLFAATLLYSMRGGNADIMNIDRNTTLMFGAKEYSLIFGAGQWWRLITAGFLHGGLIHILLNSWVIFDLGTQVEQMYGTSRYLVLYFVTTVAGFTASAYFYRGSSVGASAALFGLLGAMIALGIGNRSSIGSAMRGHYVQWAVYGLIMGFLPIFPADNAAHIGGLLAGLGLGYVMGTPPLLDRWTENVWRIAAAICVLVTVIAFASMFLFLTTFSG